MKFTLFALAAVTAVSAQLVEENGEFKCLGNAAGKNFCAGESLSINIIIRCNGEKGQPGNCNDNLAGVSPVGVKSSALCWQTSNTTGDGACSFNGIVYADDGKTFPVPGLSSSSSESPAATKSPVASVSSAAPVYTSSPVYSNSTLTTVSSPVVEPTSTTGGGATYVPPVTNHTSYTSTLPIPTQTPSSAGALFVRERIILGAVVLAGFFLL